MYSLMSVNGTPIRDPSVYDIDKKDLDSENSYTSETGILVRDMIRSNHVTIKVQWDNLKPDEMHELCNLISHDDVSQFNLTYYDYYTGQDVTGEFYAHDRSGSAIKISRYNANGYEAYSLSTTLIEF